jgi:hypothetical protein
MESQKGQNAAAERSNQEKIINFWNYKKIKNFIRGSRAEEEVV